MSFEFIEVSVQHLHLDPENPRHPEILDESLIITHLYENEKVPNLLKDVAIRGFSPLDRIGVIPHGEIPDHYVVVEGNRRICALKLLLDENLAPNQRIKTQITRAKRLLQSELPTTILVCKFETLEDASPWIDRRHMGALDGIGTRGWGAPEQARSLARRDRGNSTGLAAQQYVLAQAIVDRLLSIQKLDPTVGATIPITTLSRYLSTPTVREVLGLAHNTQLIYGFVDDEVDDALLAFVLDSLPATSEEDAILNSRSDASDRRAYALDFAMRGLRPTTPRPPSAPTPISRDENTAPDHQSQNTDNGQPTRQPGPSNPDQATNTTPGPRHGTRDPSRRPYLAPASFSVTAPDDSMLVRLRSEIRRLFVEGHEFSANYLLRAFIERVMIRFLRFQQVQIQPGIRDQRLTELCREQAANLGASRNITDVLARAASNQHCGYSLTALGGAVHCAHAPTKRDLISHFDTWEPALTYMLDHSI